MKTQQEHRTTMTSIQTFRKFIIRLPDGTLDVSGVISRGCYLAWLELKSREETDLSATAYYRALTNHVSGTASAYVSLFQTTNTHIHRNDARRLVRRKKKPFYCCFASAHLGLAFQLISTILVARTALAGFTKKLGKDSKPPRFPRTVRGCCLLRQSRRLYDLPLLVNRGGVVAPSSLCRP